MKKRQEVCPARCRVRPGNFQRDTRVFSLVLFFFFIINPTNGKSADQWEISNPERVDRKHERRTAKSRRGGRAENRRQRQKETVELSPERRRSQKKDVETPENSVDSRTPSGGRGRVPADSQARRQVCRPGTYPIRKKPRKPEPLPRRWTSSGTLEAANSYTVTTLVEGNITSADFSEGDTVEKDTALYQIDSSDVSNNIEKAQLSLSQAQRSYESALDNAHVKSPVSGTVYSLDVSVGDEVKQGQTIATVRNSSTMKLTVPFPADDARNFTQGRLPP
jgi:biotin carboxyl carrier protein